ncbi:hypothetical protein NDU88_004502 [Pleurodeles waltl]|uniref:Uncharacterized protein n=1 Tax=Pleurodeles waltl TaxID=8319 RepID=A0AAV7SJ34_PLEWA|nr:hypothetical protein NDU88_004502 [Pleurodeles waltl]
MAAGSTQCAPGPVCDLKCCISSPKNILKTAFNGKIPPTQSSPGRRHGADTAYWLVEDPILPKKDAWCKYGISDGGGPQITNSRDPLRQDSVAFIITTNKQLHRLVLPVWCQSVLVRFSSLPRAVAPARPDVARGVPPWNAGAFGQTSSLRREGVEDTAFHAGDPSSANPAPSAGQSSGAPGPSNIKHDKPLSQPWLLLAELIGSVTGRMNCRPP